MIIQLDFFGDPNVGLFGKANDDFCLIGKDIPTKKIRKALKVKVYKLTLLHTSLIGLFCALNSNGIIVPALVADEEIEKLRKICREFSINLCILKSKYTALGNLIVCNDEGAIISKVFTRKQKELIEDCLGVETVFGKIAGLNIVGSCCFATNKGCLIHRDAKESEIKKVEKVLKVECAIGTVNSGSPFISSGLIANSNGAIIGSRTTGYELSRIMEALKLT